MGVLGGMFVGQALQIVCFKEHVSGQEFIGQTGKSILIAQRGCSSLKLLGSHIPARENSESVRGSFGLDECIQAKVGQDSFAFR